MTKYVCKRDEVCGGLLLCSDEEDDTYLEDNNVWWNNNRYIHGRVSRGILFSKDEFGYARDLIFADDIKYPVKDLCSNDINSSYFINYYVCLEELLKYLGYNENLTKYELNKIYKKFILHSRWLHHNKELFGLIKMYGGGYGEGGIEMVSLDIHNTLEIIEHSLENTKALIRPQQKLIKRR